MTVSKLDEGQIEAALTGVNGWSRRGDEISKELDLGSFDNAIQFVNDVAQLANAVDHHPDILIQYKNVTLTLSTHSEGGLTDKDFALARQIDGLGSAG